MQSLALRALLGPLQKRLFATSISTSTPKSTVDYLVDLCGLPKATATMVAEKLNVKEDKLERCSDVIAFLREKGFSDYQLQQIVEKRPLVLKTGLECLRRKMKFLSENRFTGSYLVELLVSNPAILTRDVEKHLKPSLDLVIKYLDSFDKVEGALKRSSWLLTCNLNHTMQPNIDLLISEGVSHDAICLMIAKKPRAALQRPETMAQAIKAVKELGIDPSSPIFIHAVCVRVSMTDATWNGKFQVFRSLGWADEEIVSAFVRDPLCLSCSEEKIRAVTDYFVNTMKLNQDVIISYPKLLMHSIERRYKPRVFVLNILKSKKLLKELKWQWVLTRTEKIFVKNYVEKYLNQVPDLMKTYTSMLGSK